MGDDYGVFLDLSHELLGVGGRYWAQSDGGEILSPSLIRTFTSSTYLVFGACITASTVLLRLFSYYKGAGCCISKSTRLTTNLIEDSDSTG